jgi:quercetin dioxygenase-like cupin family protein
VILENEHVRVIDYRLKPGQKEPMHSHPNGVFVYYFTEANTRGSVLNGETTDTHRKAGDVVWRDPVTHVAQNVGNAEIHQLLVEPKEYCSQKQ